MLASKWERRSPHRFRRCLRHFGGSGRSEESRKGYRRRLDIGRAVHTTSYTKDGVCFTREYFSSRPDDVTVFCPTADELGSYTGSIALTDMHDGRITMSKAGLIALGQLSNNLNYEAQVRVVIRPKGGAPKGVSNSLKNGLSRRTIPPGRPAASNKRRPKFHTG